MQLSLNTIVAELRASYTVTIPDETRLYDRKLRGAGLYTRSSSDTEILYLIDAARVPTRWKDTTGLTLLIVGNLDPSYFQGSLTDYCCVDSNHLPQIMNQVVEIFNRHNRFEELLHQYFAQRESSDTICNAVHRFDGLSFLVVSSTMHVLYYSEDLADLPIYETNQAGNDFRRLSMEIVNLINLSSGSVIQRTEDVALLDDDMLPYRMIITGTKDSPARMLLFETGTPFNTQTIAAAVFMKQLLPRIFRQPLKAVIDRIGISDLIISMLTGLKKSQMDLINNLQTLGWSTADGYACVALTPQLTASDLVNTESLCLRLSDLFDSCVFVEFHEQPVGIINLTHSRIRISDIPRKLALIIRENLMYAGISFRFWNFETLPIYYKQACMAAELGALYQPDRWCYKFKDFALQYIIHYGAHVIPPRHLCHPGLVALHTYDRLHGTNYRYTLEIYIRNNCNAAITAEQLFIHRNTFYQRLQKIEELYNFNLDDHNERLYIQLSTRLIEMYDYEVKYGYFFPPE